MIIWSGWGAAIVLGGAVLGGLVGSLVHTLTQSGIAWSVGIFVGGLVAGGLIHWVAQLIESAPGRTLVDQASGQTLVWKKSAGSVFFIPTRYWAFIVPVAFLAVAVVLLVNPDALNSTRA